MALKEGEKYLGGELRVPLVAFKKISKKGVKYFRGKLDFSKAEIVVFIKEKKARKQEEMKVEEEVI